MTHAQAAALTAARIQPSTPAAPRTSRRALLVQLARALGVALALPPLIALDQHTEQTARAQTPAAAHRACACNGAQQIARAPQSATSPQAVRPQQGVRAFENRVGWAYNVRWRKSRAEVLSEFQRMAALGCNTIYIGHNSAGNADPDAFEPGLAPEAGTPSPQLLRALATPR